MSLKREVKTKLTLFSPAKLNLFFRVLKKRDDGFHEIATLMQAISLGDHLTFEKSSIDRLSSSDPTLPCDERNLVLRARDAFRKKTGISFPLAIHIEKNIPIGGGLGGGSSNCATTFFALNQLSGEVASIHDLQQWAGEFSSDAPFFFSHGTAYCTGRGEIIRHCPPLQRETLFVALTKGGMSTPEVYRHCKPHACSQKDPTDLLSHPEFVNDLEFPAFLLKPALKKTKEELLSLGFKHVLMTGSGSSFFCLGTPFNEKLSGTELIPSSYHFRTENSWYNSPECEKIPSYDHKAF